MRIFIFNYLFLMNLIFLMVLIVGLIVLNWFLIWAYSFISIIRNTFKKRENKQLWLFLIFILPFSVFFYPDLKRVQIEVN